MGQEANSQIITPIWPTRFAASSIGVLEVLRIDHHGRHSVTTEKRDNLDSIENPGMWAVDKAPEPNTLLTDLITIGKEEGRR